MEKFSFGKVNKYKLEDNFVKALKDPNFVKVVNTLNIPDEIKYRYTSSLQEIANNISLCAKCKGLSFCPYDVKGLYKDAIVEDNLIKFVYRECPFKRKYDVERDYLKNIYVYKMPKEISEASFKKIYNDYFK